MAHQPHTISRGQYITEMLWKTLNTEHWARVSGWGGGWCCCLHRGQCPVWHYGRGLGTTHCTLGIVTRASVTPSPDNDDVTTVHRIHHPIDTSELVAGSNWITSHRCPSSAHKQIDCVVCSESHYWRYIQLNPVQILPTLQLLPKQPMTVKIRKRKECKYDA